MRPKNLVRNDEIKRVVALAQELGLTIGALEVRTDGVTIHPATNPKPESAYDQWKAKSKDKASDRSAHC
jgi:hypothetical protein